MGLLVYIQVPTQMDGDSEVVKFLEQSLPIFKRWREVDLLIDKRSDEDREKYQSATYNDAVKTLFAIYRAIDQTNTNVSTDIAVARTHLNALVYESFIMLQTSLLVEIASYVETYSLDSIVTVMPQYFEKYAQRVEIIRSNINELDNKRRTQNLFQDVQAAQTSLDSLFADIIFLNEIVIHFKTLAPQFAKKIDEDNNRRNEEKIKEKNALRMQILIAILSAVLGGIITYFLTPTQQNPKDSQTVGTIDTTKAGKIDSVKVRRK